MKKRDISIENDTTNLKNWKKATVALSYLAVINFISSLWGNMISK